jgi:hypothetical protein
MQRLAKITIIAVGCFLAVYPCFAAHTLTARQEEVLASWLSRNPDFRLATDEDCKCDEDIQQMKHGDGGVWKPVPDYHPYTATGDFNGDGVSDFAVVVIDKTKSMKNFELLVFNGPFRNGMRAPAFVQSGLERGDALFFGPPRPRPYRLVVGPFESDNTAILVPHGRTYGLEGSEDE